MVQDDLNIKKKTLSLLLRREYLQPKQMQNRSKIIQLEAEINEINRKLSEKKEV
jgi:hypothetical protein